MASDRFRIVSITVPVTPLGLKRFPSLRDRARRDFEQEAISDSFVAIPDSGWRILTNKDLNTMGDTNSTHVAPKRSQDIHWQPIGVTRQAHAALNLHKPCVVWFTGLSGSGKSTIANIVEIKLHAMGLHTCLLDGDNLRHGLNKDLGFTETDRNENIRRVAEVARLMADAGLIVIVAFISPFRTGRRMARELMPANEFCEVFVDTPLEVAESRDTKGLYEKARRGILKNFTGIDSPYERPEHAEVQLDTVVTPPDESAAQIVAQLRAMGVLALT